MRKRSAYLRGYGLGAALAAGVVLSTPQAALSQGAPAGDGFDPATIDKMAAATPQVSLTEDMVDRLIKSQPEMRATAEKFNKTQLPEALPEAGASDLNSMSADKRAKLEAIAIKHGFKDLSDWSVVASSVAMAYAYAMNGKKPGSLEEAVRLNVAQVERDKKMSDAQKKQITDEYRALGDKLAQIEPLKENYELVMKMKEKITPMMDPDKK